MRLDIRPKDLLEVLFFRELLNEISLVVLEFAGRKIKINDQVHWVQLTLNCGHLYEASTNDCVHSHPQ